MRLMNDPSGSGKQERRGYSRLKVRVPVEMQVEDAAPVRGATSDLSAGGCYIETMFPLPAGTTLDMKLQLENTLLVAATVVTCDPQVGNGIRFERMLPEDHAELQSYLEKLEQDEKSKEAGAE